MSLQFNAASKSLPTPTPKSEHDFGTSRLEVETATLVLNQYDAPLEAEELK